MAGLSGEATATASDLVAVLEEIIERQNSGYFKVHEAAQILADANPGFRGADLLRRMEESYARGELVVRDRTYKAPRPPQRKFHNWEDVVTAKDMDDMLAKWGVSYRFPSTVQGTSTGALPPEMLEIVEALFPASMEAWRASGRSRISIAEALNLVVSSGTFPPTISVLRNQETDTLMLKPGLDGGKRLAAKSVRQGFLSFCEQHKVTPQDPYSPWADNYAGEEGQDYFEISSEEFELFASRYPGSGAQPLDAAYKAYIAKHGEPAADNSEKRIEPQLTIPKTLTNARGYSQREMDRPVANDNSPSARWSTWVNIPQVELWEAVALSLDFEPYALPGLNSNGPSVDIFDHCPAGFADRLKTACACLLAGSLPVVESSEYHPRVSIVNLVAFGKWARALPHPWSLPSQFPIADEQGSQHRDESQMIRAVLGGQARSEKLFGEAKKYVQQEWQKVGHKFRSKADFADSHADYVNEKFNTEIKPRTISESWLKGL